MSNFSRNLYHRQECREQREIFQTILIIIFCNFAVFKYRSDSPQVQENMISTITNLKYELSHELPNDLRLRILGNIGEIANQGGDIAQCPAPFPKIKLWQWQLKITQKQIRNFSCSVQFYWISLFCSRYFVWDCSH